uniref:7-cyano-7-deazaguanine synthase n=1 Tax=viral metagenome TaxID=1070528 RepID=A0A6M3IJ58_9ZZZZ
MKSETALVVLSGGQDSITCLFWAKTQWKKLIAITFDYGQRHKIEIEAAKKAALLAGVSHHEIQNISSALIFSPSALTSNGDINLPHSRNSDLPASFIPGRNLLFLLTAAIFAYSKGIKDIVTGVCQTDYSGYPDCRWKTINALENTLVLGMDYQFSIHTPLMWLSKKEEAKMAVDLPGCWQALAYSHTCYNGKYPPCGECPACKIRANGFTEAGLEDPLILRSLSE